MVVDMFVPTTVTTTGRVAMVPARTDEVACAARPETVPDMTAPVVLATVLDGAVGAVGEKDDCPQAVVNSANITQTGA